MVLAAQLALVSAFVPLRLLAATAMPTRATTSMTSGMQRIELQL
jgi:hypothetical protein